MVEGRNLVAEKQGGFRRGRGCRDQLLMTLVLLGQMKTLSKKGMFAGFIDFRKPTTEWTKRNYGFVWREWGLVAGLPHS